MAEGPLLSAEEFTIRKPLFRNGVIIFFLGNCGGLALDSLDGNVVAVVLDVVTLAVLVTVAFAVWVRGLERSNAVAVLVYAGASNFLLALVQTLIDRPAALTASLYNNLFILAMFLAVATFLVGRSSTLVFGGALLTVLLCGAWLAGDPWVQKNLWLEVPAIAGAVYLLFQYRGALDRLLKGMQNVIRENTALRERERLAALGEMTAGIAHEIKNPLNLVVNFAESSQELLQDLETLQSRSALSEPDRQEVAYLMRELQQNLEDIRAQGLRGATTVQAMLRHSRAASPDILDVDLNEVAAECLHLAGLGHRQSPAHQDLQVWPAPVVVRGARGDLSRALLNLISNALWSVTERAKREAGPYEGRVTVSVAIAEGVGVVRVEDNGVGLSPTVKSQLFVPFFTTKPAGEGTGLGLSLAREVAEQHSGSLTAEGEAMVGARFTLSLPLWGSRL